MESCVKKVIWNFWLERNLICQSQHGFTSNSSCTSQLLCYLDDVSNHVDDNLVVDAIYLDFAKAFNSVPHERLLRKLSALGIKGKFYQWIWSCLLNRKEIVLMNNKMSKPKKHDIWGPSRQLPRPLALSCPCQWFWWLPRTFVCPEICRWR